MNKDFLNTDNAIWPIDKAIDEHFPQRVKEIEFYTLSNGLRVLQTHDDRDRSFHVKMHVNAGAIHQSIQQRGIPHYHEHMVFKGTKKFHTKELLQDFAEDFNLNTNAYTGEISQGFHALADADIESASAACEFVSQVVFHPIFPEQEALLERDVIMSERKMYNSDPWDCLWELGSQHFYGDTHPIGGGGILGSEADIEGFKLQDVIDHHQEFFYPQNMLLQVSSGLSSGEMMQLVTKYFDIDMGSNSWNKNKLIGQTRPTVMGNSRQDKEFDATYMQVAYYIPNDILQFPELASFAVPLAVYVLSKRLFKDLRDSQGLAYAIGATNDNLMHGNAVILYGQFADDKYGVAKPQMLNYLQKLAAEPITLAEYKRAMRNKKSVRWADSASAVLDSIASKYFKYGQFLSPEYSSDYYDQMDLDYLNNFVKKYFDNLQPELIEVGRKV